MNNRGFTLLETIVAVAVLGLGLSVLIGLQSSYVDRYFEERMQAKAAFYARYIMTMVEVAEELPEPGTYQDDLRDKLQELGYFGFEPENVSIDEKEFLGEGWQTETEVESISIPFGADVFDDVIRKVTVKVSWGEEREFRIEFFKFNKEALDG